MAEIRKHKTSAPNSAIAKALEQALGAAVRPVTPGAPPRPNQPENPHVAPPTAGAAAPLPGSGWVSLSPQAAPKVAKQRDQDDELD
ncbi:hypothetical protein [Luteococcus peritonei]|uniref:Uncharacterized protein n=1 Tax=Luteococcus peritonei TaxID=88874 RepID=A0ABW4RTM9_9ACTN